MSKTTFSSPSDVEVAATRSYTAPRTLLWDCWTKPEHIPRWLTGLEGWSMPICEVDLRVGGAWRWGWRRPGRPDMVMHGHYVEIDAPSRLVWTENWGDDWPETVNTLVLTETAGITTMVQTARYPSKADRDRAMGTGAEEGWNTSLERLAEYLASRATKR